MIKTLNLNGHTSVSIDAAHVHIRNDSENNVCVSVNPNPVYGKDGVLTIPPGQAGSLYNCTGTVYANGNGAITLVTSNYVTSPFKPAPASSASSGGGTSGGGSAVTTEPVLKAGSLGYFVQQQTVNGHYNGGALNSIRMLLFVPQNLAAYSDFTMSQDWIDNALNYSGMIVSNYVTPYNSDGVSMIDNGSGLEVQPTDMGFFEPNLGSIEQYLDEAAMSGHTPFPPVQLDHVNVQGAYFWVYGNPWCRVDYHNITQPVLMLTEDLPLPLIPPDGVPI